MDNNEKQRALEIDSFQKLNRAFNRETLRVTPDDAVAKWKADGEAGETRRRQAYAEREALEQCETQTKIAAMEASRDQRVREFLRDMLPATIAAIVEHINERSR
jgi:hypothetical protein